MPFPLFFPFNLIEFGNDETEVLLQDACFEGRKEGKVANTKDGFHGVIQTTGLLSIVLSFFFGYQASIETRVIVVLLTIGEFSNCLHFAPILSPRLKENNFSVVDSNYCQDSLTELPVTWLSFSLLF